MKKVFCMFLAILMVLGAVGTAMADGSDAADTEWKRLESQGLVQTENGQEFVMITVSAEYSEGATQEAIDASAGQDYTSGVLNSDGSITYKLTKEQYAGFLVGMAGVVEEAFGQILADTTCSFTKLEHSDDYTRIDAYLGTQELGLTESFYAYFFLMYGQVYAMFAGRPDDIITVNYYGPDGQLLDSQTSESQATTAMSEEAAAAAEYRLKEADYPETVLVDNDYCKLTVHSIQANDDSYYSLKATVENKSDKNIAFVFQNGTLNGYMIDPVWSAIIPAGTTSEESIGFYKGDIMLTGADEVTEIRTNLKGFDSDTLAEMYVDEPVVIYPAGEANVKKFPRADQPTDKVVFDNEYCRMLAYDIGMDSILGYTVYLYLENKTEDRDISFMAEEGALNGIALSTLWAESVNAGSAVYSKIYWYPSTLREQGIENVEKIDIKIRSYDMSNILGDPFVYDTFTITP